MKDPSNWPSPDYTNKFSLSAVVIAHTDDPETSIIFMSNRPARKLDELDTLPIDERPRAVRVAVWSHDSTAAKILASLRTSLKHHVQPQHRLPAATTLISLPVESVIASLNAAIRQVGNVVWQNGAVCEAAERGLFNHTNPIGSRPRLEGAAA